MTIKNLLAAAIAAAFVVACGKSEPVTQDDGQVSAAETESQEISVTDAELEGNPFLEDWDTPYGIQPFDAIESSHFMPALEKGILEMRADIAAIVNNPDAPTFENTILAMETSGELASRGSPPRRYSCQSCRPS